MSNILDNIIDVLPPRAVRSVLKFSNRPLINFKRDVAFRAIIKYAYRNSRFYRRKFDEFGIDPARVKCPSDLKGFYTTSQDIIENPQDFICTTPSIVFESSGTSGVNKKIYFDKNDLNHITHMIASGYLLIGIDPKRDRVANGFDFSMWIPGLINQLALLKLGVFNMPFGKVDPLELYNRMKFYNFNIILGEPTWLIKLTEIAEKKGAFAVKLFIGAAEEMPANAYKWITDVWHGAMIRMAYASVESGGVMAYQASDECKSYHIDDTDFFVEILDKDEEGYGEVCFTTLNRSCMPLIRYRNCDISKIIDEPCKCGIPSIRLAKIRGRRDEMVVASGGNLYPLMFENMLSGVDNITNDWQVAFMLDGVREVMQFNLETDSDGSKDRIVTAVFDRMKSMYPDLWKNYCLDTFRIDFNFHKPAALRNKRKIKRVVDLRHENQE